MKEVCKLLSFLFLPNSCYLTSALFPPPLSLTHTHSLSDTHLPPFSKKKEKRKERKKTNHAPTSLCPSRSDLNALSESHQHFRNSENLLPNNYWLIIPFLPRHFWVKVLHFDKSLAILSFERCVTNSLLFG